jgi:hypothetical protein
LVVRLAGDADRTGLALELAAAARVVASPSIVSVLPARLSSSRSASWALTAAMVRATYDEHSPLAGRNMLLTLSYCGLRFRAGVRVGNVYEADREEDGRSARIYGLELPHPRGALRAGEMAYEVWKWRDSGAVEFHIHAVSRPAESGNPILRLGFHLVGRRHQLRFYHRACERMARLVLEART